MTAVTVAPQSPPHAADTATVERHVGTDARLGSAADDATARLAAVGRNEIHEAPGTPWWERLLRQFRSPLVYLLAVAIVVWTLAWVLAVAAVPEGLPAALSLVLAIGVHAASSATHSAPQNPGGDRA